MKKQELLRSYAKELRHKPSKLQVALFDAMHQEGVTRIRRRLVIGNYIIQFALPRRNLLIEIDNHKSLENPIRLYLRESWLQKQGFMFLRLREENIVSHLAEIVNLISSFDESEEIRQLFWKRVRKNR